MRNCSGCKLPPIYKFQVALSCISAQLTMGQVLEICRGSGPQFVGRYSDPNHPEGWREIKIRNYRLICEGVDEKDGKFGVLAKTPTPPANSYTSVFRRQMGDPSQDHRRQ